jgi:hypothetical protein
MGMHRHGLIPIQSWSPALSFSLLCIRIEQSVAMQMQRVHMCAKLRVRTLCLSCVFVHARRAGRLRGEADFRHVFSLAGRVGLPATVLFRYPTLATTSPCAMTGSMHAGMWLLLPLFQPPPWIHNTAANAFPPGSECVSVSPLCPSPSALAGSGLQMSSSSGVPFSEVPANA